MNAIIHPGIKQLIIAILLVVTGNIYGQTTNYDLSQLLKENTLTVYSNSPAQPLNDNVYKGISSKGIVWLNNVTFKDGTIDIDLRGKDVFLQSFLGIAFHGIDTTTYEVIYFRPFNFRHADTLRRKWSVQYMCLPDYDYDKLRKAHPLVYENAVKPVPEPANWFHATIAIKGDDVEVYVNHSREPSLKIKRLTSITDGKIGLWDDGLTGEFANLSITR